AITGKPAHLSGWARWPSIPGQVMNSFTTTTNPLPRKNWTISNMGSLASKGFGLKLSAGFTALLVLALPGPAQHIRKRTIALQSPESEGLAPGKFLVAPREVLDPNFANTVILIVRYDETGALGLVINRPTRVPISKLFHDSKVARQLDDPAYAGGPVQED